MSPGRTGTGMWSSFLLFLHSLSRTQKKVGIGLNCLISEPSVEKPNVNSFVFLCCRHTLSCSAVVFLITGIHLDEDCCLSTFHLLTNCFKMISPKENCVSVNSLHCLRAEVFSFAIRRCLERALGPLIFRAGACGVVCRDPERVTGTCCKCLPGHT